MTFKELYEKEGLEELQSKVQEWVSNKVDNDTVNVSLELEEPELIRFVFSFPEDEGKHVYEPVYFDDEIEGDNSIEGLFARIADGCWNMYIGLPEGYDLHQSNLVEKINH